MTAAQVLSTLQSLGTEQNRKIYKKHGATGDVYGVSFAHLEKLRKQIGTNHELATTLWFTANFDACNLATMVADPAAMSLRDLDEWVSAVKDHTMADLFARNVVSKTPHARRKFETWVKSKDEFIGATAYNVLASLAMNDSTLPDEYFQPWIETVEHSIHAAQNRVRHSMNNALIAIGIRNASLQRLALAAAARIGKVHVDHGETSCKTPDAADYIRKTAARQSKKSAGKKSAGKKRAAGC